MTYYYVTKAVWNKVFKSISQDQLSTVFLDYFDSIFEYIKTLELNSIIDLGCGYGKMCIKYWEMGIQDITGFDISEEGIKLAKEWAQQTGANIRFIPQDVLCLDRSYNNIECISAYFLLDNFNAKDLRKILDYIDRNTIEGGHFIFSLNSYDEINSEDYLYLKDGTYMEKDGIYSGLIINPSASNIIFSKLKNWKTQLFFTNTLGQKFYILKKNSN